ncbi:tyrosine-type recombinase/integrase [Streptomyces sp. NPDC058330]|uniref:tyrosine-type recombinase/integrase n=1 Tax=Streptomyces sp. NPDC058330 TaxID=3346449 RepID=UPI0036EAB08A
MSGNLAAVVEIAEKSEHDHEPWVAWLRTQLVEDWRPGEWDPETLLFKGDVNNPQTVAMRCSTEACEVVTKSRGRCTACAKGFRASGLSEEEFNATFRPGPNRRNLEPGTCTVERDGLGCQREFHSRGLCRAHSLQWIKATRAASKRKPFQGTFEEWLRSVAVPYDALAECRVAGCSLEQVTLHEGLCRVHDRRWKDFRGSVDYVPVLDRWVERETPYMAVHHFSLASLSEVGRLEMLYVLQQRDLRHQKMEPPAIRAVVKGLEGVECLLKAGPGVFDMSNFSGAANVVALVKEVAWSIQQGRDRFLGIEPMDKLVWDMKAVIYASGRTEKRVPGTRTALVDFNTVTQPWLRGAVMEWARSTRPANTRFRRHVAACVVASTVLGRLPGGGMDPASVRFAEMTLVADAFRKQTKRDGDLQTSKHRADSLTAFYTILDFGRSAGLLNELHGTFARHSQHRIVREDSNEDEIGKAIPESVIRQLDAHLDHFGDEFPYRGYPPEDISAMLRAIYRVLRDTGRRPREVLSLKRDCLEFDGSDCLLIWNNYKGKRMRRRLPISGETAEHIQAWAKHREGLVTPSRSRLYLFPAVSEVGEFAHLSTQYLSRAMRLWVTSIDEIHSEGTGRDGRPVPFDRDKIYPYAFRHSYAQRHADAEVPIDVLKDLMDHRSTETTARYYKVSLKRKQEAVKKMRLHVVDRHGNPAPMASNKAYELRSVAVPFGGCTEPSNVKAGGQACPIRFQCAGCGFYRPDPSYLAAIEDQIRDLKADKETALAMGTDEYVIRNLQDQIDAFKTVAKNMHEQIDQLPEEEREELMESVKVLRRSRADRGRMLPLTVIKRGESTA